MDIVQPQQNKPASGTGFTNLSQYLGANQNNQLGQTVAGGVQQAGQQASGAINQAGQDFQSGVQSEQNRLGQLGQNVTNTIGNVMNGTQGTVQDSDKSTFQTALSGQGQGPQGLANSDTLMNQSMGAQQLGQAAGTQQGRYGLLQRYVGRGQNYNIGQQGLDAMLLGQTGQNQLRQARASTAGLGQQTNQAIQAAQAQGQQLQNQAGQLATNTQGQLGQAVTNYDTQMGQNLTNQQNQYQGAINALGGTLTNQGINIDSDALAKLNTASNGAINAGTNLYNVDPTKFLSLNNLYDNNQGAQTASDFSKLQNLNQLTGNGLAGTDQGNLLQQYLSQPTAVGQFAANPYTVSNLNQLTTAINGAGTDFNSKVAAQQGAIDAINNIPGWDTRNTNTADTDMRDIYAQQVLGLTPNSPGYDNNSTAGQQQGVTDQAAMDWAKGLPFNPQWGVTGTQDPSQQAAMYYNQIQQNNRQIADANQSIQNLGNQYDKFRVINGLSNVSANPIVAGPISAS